MPKLDVSAIKKAIAKGQAAAIGSLGPGGRPRTGTKAFVREHLDIIIELRDETRATWTQVVGALAEHRDLRQGDGKPITGRRLNALVSACLKERARAEATAMARTSRQDLTRQSASAGRQRQPPTDALEEQGRREAGLAVAGRGPSDLVEAPPQQRPPAAKPRAPGEPGSSLQVETDRRSEEDLRRSGLAELKQLLKKG